MKSSTNSTPRVLVLGRPTRAFFNNKGILSCISSPSSEPSYIFSTYARQQSSAVSIAPIDPSFRHPRKTSSDPNSFDFMSGATLVYPILRAFQFEWPSNSSFDNPSKVSSSSPPGGTCTGTTLSEATALLVPVITFSLATGLSAFSTTLTALFSPSSANLSPVEVTFIKSFAENIPMAATQSGHRHDADLVQACDMLAHLGIRPCKRATDQSPSRIPHSITPQSSPAP
mmetsp:Transcript_35309/g.56332  ORF Transcript_35309/g.56332 Transcript_35309/m.56332 type:complete len:228 (+) Transcript_35309:6010-6693(+)